ncbi:hypothetical protein AHMF7605_16580 [Adhaeribacter arboris]|uniref:Fido domain-containing protein n=1 Tax=Adhaeribacter arboris TaxID=2072846 RepID=A0A2T2YHL5_9BACT|nr:Fic family protein [Adhaeribacter arboris]PSR55005.1 hypothetical protein AHMF7605_16580 [Adhaeribacter arboris]
MEHIEKALQLKGQLDKLRPIEKEQEAIITQKFRLDWNYHSNNLEGNSLTFGETKALILFGITAQGKPLKDHFEIKGHDEALKWVIDVVQGDYPLTENFIRELHALLLKESYEVNAITPDGQPTKKRVAVGSYKTTPNHVLTKTGEIFRFASPEETPALMHDLINWYKDKKDVPDVNPILLAAEFHYRFIRIHPFDDGNGRTARILMNFILMQFGYPPVIIKTEDKANYFSVLQLADSGSIEPFMDYIAKNLIRSLELMIAGASGQSIEEPDDLDKEIALLEQRFKTSIKENQVLRTKEAVLDIYDNSIAKLWERFLSSCKRFDSFYAINESTLYILGKAWKGVDAPKMIRQFIDENLSFIYLIYNFTSINYEGLTNYNFRSQIEVKFNFTEGYTIHLPDNSKLLEKPYGVQLTDKEIDELVKVEALRHKDFIERKLKEIQNKNT